MARINSDTFRTNALTVVGSIGYLVASIITIEAVFTGDPIPIKAAALFLLAGTSAMGVDFALDFLPVQIATRPPDDGKKEGR